MCKYRDAQPWSGREDPEDGPQALRMHHLAGRANADIAILGFCCDAGVRRNQGQRGAASGPAAIRHALANLAASPDLDGFHDAGDILVTGEDPAPGQQMLAKHLARLLLDHKRVLVLGGGHETAFGTWSGLRLARPHDRIGIINIDAHLDLRSVGRAGPSSGTPFWQIRQADPDNFRYAVLGVAGEGNTAALFQRAREWDVQIVPDDQLQTEAQAGFAAIDQICAASDAIYLTIDLDALPGALAPGVSAPAARGIPLHVAEGLIDRVLASGKLIAADIVELCPPNDTTGLTARCAAYIARRLMNGWVADHSLR
ncbi:formimidoylglutamase [Paracoccus sp. 11-3]|uniref:Formimidoylglutamase n=1 Tax=Paracoccus amoyensis TaxID=2760093 RepID=A0A926G7F9_9RHOB|nr:formimidoylglutamase [Paracoccus amoyensis]MBC9247228.1 formimidoylglutamase [Paracoccus amoyensis]